MFQSIHFCSVCTGMIKSALFIVIANLTAHNISLISQSDNSNINDEDVRMQAQYREEIILGVCYYYFTNLPKFISRYQKQMESSYTRGNKTRRHIVRK